MTLSSDFDPDSIIRTASRLPERPKLSSVEVKRRAETYLVAPPSAELLKAYRLTATGGVVGLMHYQTLLGIAPRTIRKYVALGVLERLPDRTPKLRKIGFTESNEALRLYTLGPVGHAMAELEAIVAPSGYHAMIDRVTHDFLATHMVVQFVAAAQRRHIPWQWRNRYQASLKFEYGGGIEPDAAILLTNTQTRHTFLFLLEYHNEDSRARVAEKLWQYARSSWGSTVKDRSPWWNHDKPTLLCAATHEAPVTGYQDTLHDPTTHALKNRVENIPAYPIFGNTLASLAKHRRGDVWLDLRSKVFTDVFSLKPVTL